MKEPQNSADVEPEQGDTPSVAAERVWPPSEGTKVGAHLPFLKGDWGTQLFVRGSMWLSRNRLVLKSGVEHIARENDPFIVAANHNQRTDAVVLPALLFYHREGKRVHFLADWPMMLVPGIGWMYRCGQIIPVFNKKTKPAFLNSLKRFYEKPGTAWERAGETLEQGGSVGSFVEGTLNRNPRRLMRGRLGAAQLAIKHNVPVVPAGIRFPQHRDAERIPDAAPMEIEIGAPMKPPDASAPGADSKELVRAFQARIMTRLSELSGKSWTPPGSRRKDDGP